MTLIPSNPTSFHRKLNTDVFCTQEKERAAFEVDKHGRSKRNRRSRLSKQALSLIMEAENESIEKLDKLAENMDDEDMQQWVKTYGELNEPTGGR